MKLDDKIYDVLSFIGRILLPSLATLVIALFKIWLPSSELGTLIGGTIMALDTFLNACLGVSTANYYKDLAEDDYKR